MVVESNQSEKPGCLVHEEWIISKKTCVRPWLGVSPMTKSIKTMRCKLARMLDLEALWSKLSKSERSRPNKGSKGKLNKGRKILIVCVSWALKWWLIGQDSVKWRLTRNATLSDVWGWTIQMKYRRQRAGIFYKAKRINTVCCICEPGFKCSKVSCRDSLVEYDPDRITRGQLITVLKEDSHSPI